MNEASDVRDTLAAMDRRLGEIRQHMVTILEELAAHTGESEAEMEVPEATGVTAGLEPLMAEPAPPVADAPPPDLDSAADAFALADSPAYADQAAEPELLSETEPPPEPEPPRDPEPPLHAEPGADVERLEQLRERLLESAREIDGLRRVATEARASRVVFEGEVTLVVRGVDRLRTLLALEEGLRDRPGIERAAVSAYVPGEARVHLMLTRPMELAAELERVLPFTYTLRASSCLELVVDLGTERLDT